LRNARAFPLLPAALASVPFGFVLVRVRVQQDRAARTGTNKGLKESRQKAKRVLKSDLLRNNRTIIGRRQNTETPAFCCSASSSLFMKYKFRCPCDARLRSNVLAAEE
jgi:hypothetical protein